jgi:hypothetical protein
MDRDFEPWPQIDESAEMIFVRMGEHKSEQIAAFLDQIADVGKNEIDPREIISGEGDAKVDRKPAPVALPAEAIKREIHADLADPTQRGKNELIGGTRHARLPINQPAGSLRQPRPCA